MAQKLEKLETFEVDGVEYKSNPTIEEFVIESGAGGSKAGNTKLMNALKAAGITEPDQFFGMFLPEIEKIEGVSSVKASKIYTHASRVMRRGDLLLNVDKMREREASFNYLPTGSSSLDKMLTYSDGNVGYRSKTMIELYGGAASGKTQICLTASCMVLRSEELGGWGKGVAYIDSEGSFEFKRFERLARYWGVETKTIKKRFLYARAINFDDVELALNEISKKIKKMNIGIIIIDSIMDPLKSQYPVGGEELRNLQPRQKHLKRVLDKLKNMAEINNLVTIYTNHIRSNIGGYGAESDAQGGAVIAHASDIRIMLDKATKDERRKESGSDKMGDNLKMGRAKIVDSGFVGSNKGFYLIGPMGIADPVSFKEISTHATMIAEKGYMCINALGEVLEPMEKIAVNRDEKISKWRSLLYKPKEEEIPVKKTKSKKKKEVEDK